MIITSIPSSHNNEMQVKVMAFENFPEIINALIDGVSASELASTLEQVETPRAAKKRAA